MLNRLNQILKGYGQSLTDGFGGGLSTPGGRRAARRHFLLIDHGALRALWSGFTKVADGVYRSNQPSPARLKRYRDFGIRSVLNLRGKSDTSFYLFETEACAALGLNLVSLRMNARTLPPRETFLELHRIFQTIEHPFVIHCKSGADRTGLVSAMYLLMLTDAPVRVAARQLSWRFLHFKNTKAGLVDHVLRVYDRAHRDRGLSFLDWLRDDYDPEAITRSFADWRAGKWNR